MFIEKYVHMKFCLDCVIVESVSDIPEAVYFTRTTLFAKMFTVTIVVKSRCIHSFVLIGCCVRELHSHLYTYCKV